MHLLDHALFSASGLRLDELPGMSYGDYVYELAPDDDGWQIAVENAVACLVHEMMPALADYQSLVNALSSQGALGECKPDDSPFADNWCKGMYTWLHQHYPDSVEPWSTQLEQLSRPRHSM